MRQLIKLTGREMAWADDVFTDVEGDDAIPADGAVILSVTRFQAEGDALLGAGRQVGVRIASDEAVEDLAYDLPRIAVVVLEFPKFRDGRGFTSARLLRDRLGYAGEIRAVGDVLREQAGFMVRCGVNAFVPADGADPKTWAKAASRFRHVYQRAADARAPAFEVRAG